MAAMAVVVITVVTIALVYTVLRSVINRMSQFLDVVLDSGPSMYMSKLPSGSDGPNGWELRALLLVQLFQVHKR